MRILFLDHPQHTHGTWTLYQALGRVLGWESVVDFPPKETFRGKDHRPVSDPTFRRLYQAARGKLPAGIPPFAPGEELVSARFIASREIGAHHQMTSQRRYSWHEVITGFSSFDLIILGNSHRVPTLTLALLREHFGRNGLPPIVYFDAGERDELNAHWWHVFRPEMTFKQILTPAVAAKPNASCVLYPLPLANAVVTNADIMKACNIGAPKVRDILFHHGITWEPREGVLQTVRDWLQTTTASSGAEHTWKGGEEYFSAIAGSRMALSIRGSGRDTTRYWEIPALETLLVADGTMGCIHPFPFRDGETAAFYTSLDELRSKLDFYHHNEEARQTVARAGRVWAERYHSFEARGLFFLGLVQKNLGLKYTDEQQQRVNEWLSRLGWLQALPDWSGPTAGYEP